MNSVARTEAEAWIGSMVPPLVNLLQTIIGDMGVAFAYIAFTLQSSGDEGHTTTARGLFGGKS